MLPWATPLRTIYDISQRVVEVVAPRKCDSFLLPYLNDSRAPVMWCELTTKDAAEGLQLLFPLTHTISCFSMSVSRNICRYDFVRHYPQREYGWDFSFPGPKIITAFQSWHTKLYSSNRLHVALLQRKLRRSHGGLQWYQLLLSANWNRNMTRLINSLT